MQVQIEQQIKYIGKHFKYKFWIFQLAAQS